jgi:enamine deaminase RidA (YjgF/YER057c/UK114 family)
MIRRVGGTKRYSDYVINNNIVYLSGVVSSKDSLLEQTYDVLNQIENLLKEANSSKKNILQMFIYMNDENDYETMNIAFDSWIPNNCAPARATFGNIKFPNNKWKIEIVVSAYIE